MVEGSKMKGNGSFFVRSTKHVSKRRKRWKGVKKKKKIKIPIINDLDTLSPKDYKN